MRDMPVVIREAAKRESEIELLARETCTSIRMVEELYNAERAKL
jgi:hypothetical protein